eukprot:NODE_1373_length_2502_cov_3.687579.p1 GENE.NODE_1373_length_2502_cov_3.687579~~NODE_1373_length_2502_cov_3.687579.p1  ORF type:complete len:404 (-),score=91.05 NODE_1373_length_2502_cov_3.687579:394-1605(-)
MLRGLHDWIAEITPDCRRGDFRAMRNRGHESSRSRLRMTLGSQADRVLKTTLTGWREVQLVRLQQGRAIDRLKKENEGQGRGKHNAHGCARQRPQEDPLRCVARLPQAIADMAATLRDKGSASSKRMLAMLLSSQSGDKGQKPYLAYSKWRRRDAQGTGHEIQTAEREAETLNVTITKLTGALNDASPQLDGLIDSVASSESVAHGSASLLQLHYAGAGRLSTRTDRANFAVVDLARRLAKESNDAALRQLASRIAAEVGHGAASGQDPFAKVKTTIQELLNRLEGDASADASRRANCDKEYVEAQEEDDAPSHEISKYRAKRNAQHREGADYKFGDRRCGGAAAARRGCSPTGGDRHTSQQGAQNVHAKRTGPRGQRCAKREKQARAQASLPPTAFCRPFAR